MDKAECHILCIFRYIAISIVGMLMLSMASCISSTNYKESLDSAQISIESEDYRMARSICDEVFDQQMDSEEGDASVLARLSILYMKLADHNEMTDREDNLDYAYECYEKAFSIDSLEAREYYKNIGIDDMPQMVLLESIVKSSKVDLDSIYFNEKDSVFL